MALWSESLDQIDKKFREDGFAIAEGIADRECLDTLLPIYDAFVDGTIDCPTSTRKLGGLTRQIIAPHLYSKELRENNAIANAREIARRLQGVDEPEFVFSMMIYKPGLHPHETPWHQDMSYVATPTMPKGASLPNNSVVTFWLALNDVDETMGCMEFLPGQQNQPIPEHYVYSGDPKSEDRLLAITDVEKVLDISKSVECPLKAGSATIHGYATPHFTKSNRSDRPRRAFIFSFNRPDTVQMVGKELVRMGAL